MNPPITAPFTLDAIMQEIRYVIAHSDPKRIEGITKHVQGILPAEGAEVKLRASCNNEDNRAVLMFLVSETIISDTNVSLEEIFLRLLSKSSLDDANRAGVALELMAGYEGDSFD